MSLYKDRQEAGQLLAEKLKDQVWDDALVLALPRGGVPVAYEVSKRLEIPLDILLVKKIGAPNHPEFAIGAISSHKIGFCKYPNQSIPLHHRKRTDLVFQEHQTSFGQIGIWRDRFRRFGHHVSRAISAPHALKVFNHLPWWGLHHKA